MRWLALQQQQQLKKEQQQQPQQQQTPQQLDQQQRLELRRQQRLLEMQKQQAQAGESQQQAGGEPSGVAEVLPADGGKADAQGDQQQQSATEQVHQSGAVQQEASGHSSTANGDGVGDDSTKASQPPFSSFAGGLAPGNA